MRFLLNKIFTNNSKNCLQKEQYLLCKYNIAGYSTVAHNENKEDEQESKVLSEQRSLAIALIGVPNSGKSTFINNVINHRVCPTSQKVHTTRNANKAIYTTGNTQLIFYDTPGLVTQREVKKHHLEKSFMSAYRHAIQHADVIAVLHDVSNTYARNALHSTVIDTLKAYPTMPSLLILNKIDALKSKRILLDTIRTVTNNTLNGANSRRKKSKLEVKERNLDQVLEFGKLHKAEVSWSNFSDVFLVSSITGSGLSDVQNYLIESAKDRPWEYSSETFTDATPEAIVVNSVRARLLDYLPQEIPYKLNSVIEYYSIENGTIYTSVQVQCPTKRIERLICGESNGRLRQITERVTSDLVETFGKQISLTISTIAKKEKNED